MNTATRFFVGMILCTSAAHAAAIAQVSGPTFLASGLGSGNGHQAAAMGFGTTNTLTGVTITAPISVLVQNTAIDAYLTHQIGPGTLPADVLAHSTITVPVNTSTPSNYQFTTTTFFSGLTLSPGNYYLTLVETDGSNNAGVGEVLNGSQVFTFAPGVTFLGTFGTAQQSGTFAPGYGGYSNNESASIFGGDNAFAVTGTILPEPAAALMAGTLLIGARRKTR